MILAADHRNQDTEAVGLGCCILPISLPSLGTMFLTMNASQEPGVKTSFQGWRMSLAEESLGCHFCRALDSLLRMGEYSGSRRACIKGSHGWIQEWMGTVSVSGFQFSTCSKSGAGGKQQFIQPVGQTMLCVVNGKEATCSAGQGTVLCTRRGDTVSMLWRSG